MGMEIDQSVDYILSTYDLGPAKKDRVAQIAKRTLRQRYQHNFDEQYVFIARLVDRVTVSDRERTRYGVRPHKVRRLIRFPRHARPYEPIDNLIEAEADDEPAKEAFTVLWAGLNPRRYEFLKELWRAAGPHMTLDPRQTRRELPQIKQRLRQLEREYRFGDRILVPLRPIRRIRFDPLSIEFRKRKIDGDPLGYLGRYRRVYGPLSRNQLFQLDQGLYQALRNANRLDEAFPKANGHVQANPKPPYQLKLFEDRTP